MNMEMKKRQRQRRSERSREPTYYYSCNSFGCGIQKWIYLLLLLTLSLNIDVALSSCPPLRIKNGKVQVHESPYNGKYPNGSQALASCDPGYHLKSGETLYCIKDSWVASDGRMKVKAESVCGK
jgi:hypothetical protein